MFTLIDNETDVCFGDVPVGTFFVRKANPDYFFIKVSAKEAVIYLKETLVDVEIVTLDENAAIHPTELLAITLKKKGVLAIGD